MHKMMRHVKRYGERRSKTKMMRNRRSSHLRRFRRRRRDGGGAEDGDGEGVWRLRAVSVCKGVIPFEHPQRKRSVFRSSRRCCRRNSESAQSTRRCTWEQFKATQLLPCLRAPAACTGTGKQCSFSTHCSLDTVSNAGSAPYCFWFCKPF